MFEDLGIAFLSPREASALFGLALGLAFGALGLLSGFCFRRAVAGPREERPAALGLWAVALAAAVTGTQAAVLAGLIDFAGHRFVSPTLQLPAVLLGGVLFGAGMVLTRGCASRLVVLAGGGNLRALLVVAVLAIVAMATMRGALAPLRSAIGSVTVPVGGALPGPVWAWAALTVAAAAWLAWRGRIGLRGALAGVAIGLLVPAGWVGTGLILADDFDPIPFESLSYTGPAGDALFWAVAATAVPAGFGAGLIGGTLLGSLAAALAARRFRWQSFSTPRETLRYLAGAAMMGFGGVLAGGCTVGAGLGGLPSLGLAAALALAAIWAGARLTDAALSAARGSGAPAATRAGRPAA